MIVQLYIMFGEMQVYARRVIPGCVTSNVI